MKTSDFYYDLPEELIAQDPLEDRASSRLLVLNKKTGEIEHTIFKNIKNYLKKGDCLVINNTKVIPARLIGEKEGSGGKVEFLLLKKWLFYRLGENQFSVPAFQLLVCYAQEPFHGNNKVQVLSA